NVLRLYRLFRGNMSMKMTMAVFLIFVLIGMIKGLGQETPVSPRHRLMPAPAALRFETGRLTLDTSFKAAIKGYTDARLQAGLARALGRLENRTGLDLAGGLSEDAAGATLVVQCQDPGPAVPSVNEDESYALSVSARQAALGAATVVGALRGLETFLQLVEG